MEGKDLATNFGRKKMPFFICFSEQSAECLKMTASYAVRETMKQAQVRPKGDIIKHGKKQVAERNAVPRQTQTLIFICIQPGRQS